jgi:hypothetical protein
MAAKLKVFTWSDGFHAFTVAASSRPKALGAWGVDQDLFKTGLAHETENGADRDAALAAPGAVISRGLSVDVGEATVRKPKPAKSKPDVRARARLTALEAELEAMDSDHAAALEAFDDRQAALDRERAAAEADQARSRKALLAKLKGARAAV